MKKTLSLTLILLLTVGLFGCKKTPAEETTAADPASNAPEYSITDGNGLDFTPVFAYSGAYVEDGSNEELSNVAAIRVKNSSDRLIRYLELAAETDGGELHFTCTTLLPGRTALLQETSRAPFTGGETKTVRSVGETDFEEALTLYPDTFQLAVKGNVLTLKNVSAAPVAGEVFVYYKRADTEGYVGGITYRVRFADLAPGASVSRSSSNLSEKDCDILFIGCENPPAASAAPTP